MIPTVGVAADDARARSRVIAVHARFLDHRSTAVLAVELGERGHAASLSTALFAADGAADDAVAVHTGGAVTARFCWVTCFRGKA